MGGERSRACLGQLGWREPARSSPDDMLAKNVAYQHIDRSTDQAERLRLLPAQVAACSSDPETLVSWLAVLRTAFVARLLGPRSPTVTAGAGVQVRLLPTLCGPRPNGGRCQRR